MSTQTPTSSTASNEKRLAELLVDDPEALHSKEPGVTDALSSAAVHGLFPLVAMRIVENSAVSQNLTQDLANRLRLAAANELLLGSETRRLVDELTTAGIEFLLLKGTALAYTLYPQPYMRPRVDTDILFPDRTSAEVAAGLLAARGYTRKLTTTGEYVGYQFSCVREIQPGVGSLFDLHVKINDYPLFARSFTFDELAASSMPVPKLHPAARGLGRGHALLLACMHYVTNLALGIADRLIWLYDLHLLTASFADSEWQELARLATGKQLCGTVLIALRKAAGYFPVPLPAPVEARLQAGLANEPFKPHPGLKRSELYWASWKALTGIGAKARMVREHLLPSPEYMRAKYATRNNLLLPFLYFHRVFAGLGKYF